VHKNRTAPGSGYGPLADLDAPVEGIMLAAVLDVHNFIKQFLGKRARLPVVDEIFFLL
jgi:hypothetical protein